MRSAIHTLIAMLVTLLVGLKLTVRPDLSWFAVAAPVWAPFLVRFVAGFFWSLALGTTIAYKYFQRSRHGADSAEGRGGEKV